MEIEYKLRKCCAGCYAGAMYYTVQYLRLELEPHNGSASGLTPPSPFNVITLSITIEMLGAGCLGVL